MHDYGTRETWPFECLRCQHIWAEEYILRQVTDKRGNITEVWLSDDVPVQPPLISARCPACQGTSITAFPKGYLDRHPDLLPREPHPIAHVHPDLAPLGTFDPGMAYPDLAPAGSATPPVEPFGTPPPEAARSPHRRLATARTVYLAAIALAAFLVAAYEIYEIVLTKARPH